MFQLHPSRFCNLRCQHCYSQSSPEARGSLPLELIRSAINGAKAEGYNVVSFSGGEPLLYEGLAPMLEYAKSLGLTTAITTNGTLLTPKRLNELVGHLDLMAISLDGKPEAHNRMRASKTAFNKLEQGLRHVRESGLNFGFIFTLTQYNVHELGWVAEFAASRGAKLLQIHPLEEVGRAQDLLVGESPDETEGAVAFVEALRIQKQFESQLAVQVDLIHRKSALKKPERLYAGRGFDTSAPLAELVSPLILEPDGTLTPLQFGFARDYALGNLFDRSFSDLAQCWKTKTLATFNELCQDTFERHVEMGTKPFFNWYEAVSSLSHHGQAA